MAKTKTSSTIFECQKCYSDKKLEDIFYFYADNKYYHEMFFYTITEPTKFELLR